MALTEGQRLAWAILTLLACTAAAVTAKQDQVSRQYTPRPIPHSIFTSEHYTLGGLYHVVNAPMQSLHLRWALQHCPMSRVHVKLWKHSHSPIDGCASSWQPSQHVILTCTRSSQTLTPAT